MDAQHSANVRDMLAKAGASGDANSTGTAKQSSGPSANYAGKIVARVKPNIVFADDISGNPTAEVEVKTAPDGTIVGRRLVKSSGNRAWDDAVIKALDKTEVLPRDTDGRVPSLMVIAFRPRD
jgi:colicin import membrane protein